MLCLCCLDLRSGGAKLCVDLKESVVQLFTNIDKYILNIFQNLCTSTCDAVCNDLRTPWQSFNIS